MDNFMDRLAQKFSAQEMIKANSQAEAAEIKRLQFQVSEYEKILQEMRRLNYKNTEISEKLDEMIGDGAKKLFGMKEEQEKLVASMRDIAVEQTRTREAELSQRERALLERERAAEQERLTGERALEQERMEKERALEQARMEKERAEHERQERERMTEEVRQERERAERERQERERVAEEARLERERAMQEAEEALREDGDGEQKENDFNAIADIIEEKFKYSDDFMHKESVKVYRNVQAVVVEELKRYADGLTAENNRLRSKMSNVMTVSVISMVASVAGLAISLLLLTVLGVF
ncbi:MAG: hypothetical protein NC337_06480 [Roseburia sp.]|nr:hypothetical protein [Roseburia sp.]